MDPSQHPATQPKVLADLQSRDPVRESVALRMIMNHLLEHAARELGAKRQFVNSQADSVMQHVVAKELAGGSVAYKKFVNDEHLLGRLHLAVNHRIQELLRSRKERASHLEQAGQPANDEARRLDPADGQAGPRTEFVRRAHRSHLDELNEQSRERLLAATPAADRELVRLAVFEGRRSESIAKDLGMTADNVRMRMSRLRRRLRECLLAPVVATLGAEDRALVEALFVERIDLEVLSNPAREAQGETAAVLAHRVTELVKTPLVESLGDEGVVYLLRLLGKAKPA